MTKAEFAIQAAAECSSPLTTAHHGGSAGRPFWNAESFQFMYVPAFQFQPLPGIRKYRYSARDENGNLHTFDASNACALLDPIWKDIPEGVVTLTVSALDKEDREAAIVGTRTFFKLASFPSDLPAAECSYKEASAKAFEYAMKQSLMRHWLTHGTPDPDYDYYVYPSKMIASIISAMIYYAKVCPDKSDDALTIARRSADYLISVTPSSGPMEGIPPTYKVDFRPDPETRQNHSAMKRLDWVMMIYPPRVGISYLELEARTGDAKYLDAALRIGKHFREHVEECGTWYLIRHRETGEVISQNLCDPLKVIVPFLMGLYKRTGDAEWKKLADGAIEYVENTSISTYSWGAQFEDSDCAVNYSNLTHYSATALIRYYTQYYRDDPVRMERADDLMRFVEDQFVVWKRPSPWNRSNFDTSLWPTPCGLEQYHWHVPIDSSTADIASAFLDMYKAGRGELHLEKAKALVDSITRAQQPDGMIPTHWMSEKYLHGSNFWINCMLYTAQILADFSEFLENH